MSNGTKQTRGPGGRFASGTTTRTGPATRTGPTTRPAPGASGGSDSLGRGVDPKGPPGGNRSGGPGDNPAPAADLGANRGPAADLGANRTAPLSNEGQAPGETFVILDTPPKGKGGRPKGFSPKAAAAAAFEDQHKQNEELAQALVMVLSGVAQTALGSYAAMREHESELIAEPLTRVLDRMTPKRLADIQKFADPLLLAVGVFAYGARVLSERPKVVVPTAVTMSGEPSTDPANDIPTGAQLLTQDLGIAAQMGGGGL